MDDGIKFDISFFDSSFDKIEEALVDLKLLINYCDSMQSDINGLNSQYPMIKSRVRKISKLNDKIIDFRDDMKSYGENIRSMNAQFDSLFEEKGTIELDSTTDASVKEMFELEDNLWLTVSSTVGTFTSNLLRGIGRAGERLVDGAYSAGGGIWGGIVSLFNPEKGTQIKNDVMDWVAVEHVDNLYNSFYENTDAGRRASYYSALKYDGEVAKGISVAAETATRVVAEVFTGWLGLAIGGLSALGREAEKEYQKEDRSVVTWKMVGDTGLGVLEAFTLQFAAGKLLKNFAKPSYISSAESALAKVSNFFKTNIAALKNPTALASRAGSVVPGSAGNAKPFVWKIRPFFSKAVSAIKSIPGVVGGAIKSTCSVVGGFVKNVFSSIGGFTKSAFAWIGSAAKTVWSSPLGKSLLLGSGIFLAHDFIKKLFNKTGATNSDSSLNVPVTQDADKTDTPQTPTTNPTNPTSPATYPSSNGTGGAGGGNTSPAPNLDDEEDEDDLDNEDEDEENQTPEGMNEVAASLVGKTMKDLIADDNNSLPVDENYKEGEDWNSEFVHDVIGRDENNDGLLDDYYKDSEKYPDPYDDPSSLVDYAKEEESNIEFNWSDSALDSIAEKNENDKGKSYTPKEGDIVFIDNDKDFDGNPENTDAVDRLGIIEKIETVVDEDGNEKTIVTVIEGDVGENPDTSTVQRKQYEIDSEKIVGYGTLKEYDGKNDSNNNTIGDIKELEPTDPNNPIDPGDTPGVITIDDEEYIHLDEGDSYIPDNDTNRIVDSRGNVLEKNNEGVYVDTGVNVSEGQDAAGNILIDKDINLDDITPIIKDESENIEDIEWN